MTNGVQGRNTHALIRRHSVIANLLVDLPVLVIPLVHYVSPSSAVASLEAVLYLHSDDSVEISCQRLEVRKGTGRHVIPTQEVLNRRGCIPEVTDRTGRESQLWAWVEADTLTCIASQFHPLARAGCSNHWLAVCIKVNL